MEVVRPDSTEPIAAGAPRCWKDSALAREGLPLECVGKEDKGTPWCIEMKGLHDHLPSQVSLGKDCISPSCSSPSINELPWSPQLLGPGRRDGRGCGFQREFA